MNCRVCRLYCCRGCSSLQNEKLECQQQAAFRRRQLEILAAFMTCPGELRPRNATKCCALQTFEPDCKCCLKSTVLQVAAEKSEKTSETSSFCSETRRLLRTVLWKRLISCKKTLTYLHSDPTICDAKGFAVQTGCMIGLRSLPMAAEN